MWAQSAINPCEQALSSLRVLVMISCVLYHRRSRDSMSPSLRVNQVKTFLHLAFGAHSSLENSRRYSGAQQNYRSLRRASHLPLRFCQSEAERSEHLVRHCIRLMTISPSALASLAPRARALSYSNVNFPRSPCPCTRDIAFSRNKRVAAVSGGTPFCQLRSRQRSLT